MSKFDENILAYLAGFFDAEGSIFLSNRKSGYGGYCVKVSNTVRLPLERYVDTFGGKIYEENRTIKGIKNIYNYVTNDQNRSLGILIELYPYLIVKSVKVKEILNDYGVILPYSRYDDDLVEELEVPYPYMAGFFDGDGCVTVIKKKGSYSLRPKICVTQISELVCRFFECEFGGFMTVEKTKIGSNAFRWITCSPKGIDKFYDKVGPYLLLKGERLELLIKMYSIKLSKWSSSTQYNEKLEIADQIHALNN